MAKFDNPTREMRNLGSRLARAAFFLVGVTLVWLLAGCTSLPGGNGSPLKVLQTNVYWKMEAYNESVTLGNITAGEQQQISAAYNAYQEAFKQALAAAHGNLEAPVTPNLQQLADQLFNLIAAAL